MCSSFLCRFGESAELLHGFDEPFTVGTGAHVLQQLSFSQSRTNFAEVFLKDGRIICLCL